MNQSVRLAIKIISAVLIAAIGLTLIKPVQEVKAASVLTVTPYSWNVIGLDSNNVNTGPNEFPVGAKVCNSATGTTATDVTVTLNWDSANPYINVSSTSSGTLIIPSIAPGNANMPISQPRLHAPRPRMIPNAAITSLRLTHKGSRPEPLTIVNST